ncbi:uncharacterized protein LOC106089602 isoform X2 [Stomoxys calcitrans]|nr:uncharacterized protein LOC106089602 isoform X2 [Stomoxys calcitrans]XP_059216962.1 uncharacterized protein LOC106089602 isoform X2 [Stomoxys calcitrans]XP_059216992.1 uncharacterized protein LOC106089602 isoform X2 [Stomoxys calcitrans]
MHSTWLWFENTSKIALITIALALMVAHATSSVPNVDTSATTSTTTTAKTSSHVNSLADDIEHEEFIDTDSQQPHSRRKRLIWITDDGRLALPPGTSLTFTPTIAMPLVRHPPEGFFSNLTISFPVTIDFDKLGLTDNQNPLGDLPPIFARSFGHSAGEMLGGYMTKLLHFKRKRDLSEQNKLPITSTDGHFNIKEQQTNRVDDDDDDDEELPQLPERFKHIFHGGERVILYGVVEDFLATFGMNGKACLLRTICEVHSRTVDHYGVFGEMAKLFLTVTRSPFSDLIPEYVKAQEIGEGRTAPGECFPYYKDCPRSVFKAMQKQRYRESQRGEYHEQEAEEISKPLLPNHMAAAEILDQQILENEVNPENIDIKRKILNTKRSNSLYSM